MFWVDEEYHPKAVSHQWVKDNGYVWFTNAGTTHYYAKVKNGGFDYQTCVKVVG